MVTVTMTLAEWREMLHPVRTESIGNMSISSPVSEYHNSLDVAFAERDAACDTLTAIRKIVNTSPIYSQREQHDKFEEIKKLVNNA